MLNEKGERELAYVVKIDDVVDTGVEGVKNKHAIVNGWKIFVKPEDFKPGDLAVYFEIDSLCPYNETFAFLDAIKDETGKTIKSDMHRIKTQKFIKGQVLSQGLLMKIDECHLNHEVKLGDFLTKELDITYYEAEDNQRKANMSAYMSMQARHKKFFKTKFGKWLMKREWGRKVCFLFLGKKKDKKLDWPDWVSRTDEERSQNCFYQMKELGKKWIRTEKIDGTSTTFTMKQAKPKKRIMLTCSRNVVFNAPAKEEKNFYKDTDGNVYLEMASKYNMNAILNYILDKHPEYEYITIQGETYGGTIQKRKYGNEHKLAIFNYKYKENGKAPVRLNPVEMTETIKQLNEELNENLECVPVLDTLDNPFELPETCDDLLAIAGAASKIDGGMREGIVLRSLDGESSFKAVDNEFLLKYHN